jgi:hypothetical protein
MPSTNWFHLVVCPIKKCTEYDIAFFINVFDCYLISVKSLRFS